MNNDNVGTLYIVATPIGNLGDMTLRGLEILKSVDLIACEDTRVTGILLKHFEIKKPMVSYFQHSQLSKIEFLISELQNGKNIALVTDAGTPGISDPGEELIHQIRNSSRKSKVESRKWSDNENIGQYKSEIKVIPIPGVSALTAAASVSGMIEKEFYFAGFMAKKKGRQTKFKMLLTLDCPIVIYESALRLEKTLDEIKSYFGENAEVFISGHETDYLF